MTGMLVVSLQILLSLRVFGMESRYIDPFRYRLVLCLKEFTKNDHTEISLRGQFKLEPHLRWPPLGVLFEFSDEHPRHFYMGVSPGT